jgi:CBS-domain-containing membrane protein
MRVEDIMTRNVLTIGPEAEVRDVARILVDNHVSGLPVCGIRREVLGVVSEGDILYKEQGSRPVRRSWLTGWLSDGGSFRAAIKAGARTAGEAMTSPAITVPSYCSVAEAARLMSEEGVNRLPVVRGQELVGIVTRADLVRAFARSDEDIRREIKEDVLRRVLWIEVEAIGIDVTRGAVRLTGKLETRSEALLLERLAARVPGVVSVESELTWTSDDTTRRAKRLLRGTQEPVGRG